MRQSINAPVSLIGSEWSSDRYACHAGVASPVVESGEVSATRGHDTSPPRLHFVCSNGPVGEVNRVGCDRPVLSTRHRSVRGVPARSPSFTFAPWSGVFGGGATRPEYVTQITASFGGCRESLRGGDVRNVASGYLGGVCAGVLAGMARHLVEPARSVAATVVTRVGPTTRTPGSEWGEEMPGWPIEAIVGRVDKWPNGSMERVRNASPRMAFRTWQGAAPVRSGKGHVLVVSTVLSVGGGDRVPFGGGWELRSRRPGGPFRFRARTALHSPFTYPSCPSAFTSPRPLSPHSPP
ncbi:hypothetical protein SSPS47_10765 [Streptomyces sp. S4.7]|nr:hypothetical protein SSPS47_10765 [Streptomyces sp. S4.7]